MDAKKLVDQYLDEASYGIGRLSSAKESSWGRKVGKESPRDGLQEVANRLTAPVGDLFAATRAISLLLFHIHDNGIADDVEAASKKLQAARQMISDARQDLAETAGIMMPEDEGRRTKDEGPVTLGYTRK